MLKDMIAKLSHRKLITEGAITDEGITLEEKAGGRLRPEEKAERRWRLELGRIETRMADLSSRLDTAEVVLTEEKRNRMERIEGGGDAHNAAVREATENVSALQGALNDTRRKKEAAAAALQKARAAVEQARIRELLERGCEGGAEIQVAMDTLAHAVAKWAPTVDELRVLGDDEIRHCLTNAVQGFPIYFAQVCPALANRKALMYVAFLPAGKNGAICSQPLTSPIA